MPEHDPSALTPLILYALWAVALQVLLAFARFSAMRRDNRLENSFKPTGDTDQLDAHSRAHMNTVENLPVFTLVYLSALWLATGAPVEAIGWTALGARMLQSLCHIASRENAFVRLRAAMQFVQIICFSWLGVAALIAANS